MDDYQHYISNLLFKKKFARQKQRIRSWKNKAEVLNGKKYGFQVASGGTLKVNERICVSDDEEIKRKLLEEAHTSPYSMHTRATKMYQDLKKHF